METTYENNHLKSDVTLTEWLPAVSFIYLSILPPDFPMRTSKLSWCSYKKHANSFVKQINGIPDGAFTKTSASICDHRVLE